ncbi:hypothetical protein GGX14DRAFT_402878 [Mycena pura]|uniref:Uncharacterized protein n=1 Tax=Mycena pura TaxID=153505 RepID=A0AAD6UXM7_9AGAR|nr:hypothetical protein GGX14DRAFT_402878 [Mycena pura]
MIRSAQSVSASDVERARMNLKLEAVLADPGSVPNGSLAIEDLCTWIERAPATVQDARVTDLTWWEAKAGLRHQFVILCVRMRECASDDSEAVRYLKLERVGKAVLGTKRLAIDIATMAVENEAADVAFVEQNRLFCALLSEAQSVMVPLGAEVTPAFQDFLDHKWRGPPLTLKNLGHYLSVIIAEEPLYNLTSANCFWLARQLTHVVAQRHYSFPFIAISDAPPEIIFAFSNWMRGFLILDAASKELYKIHDPSSIGLFFRFLRLQEKVNGLLMVRRLILILAVLSTCGVVGAYIYGWITGFILVMVLFVVMPVGLGYCALIWVQSAATIRIHRQKCALLKIFLAEDPAGSRRHIFAPKSIPRIKTGWLTASVSPGPRSLPARWERDEQIYSREREAYEAAWKKMCTAQTLQALPRLVMEAPRRRMLSASDIRDY